MQEVGVHEHICYKLPWIEWEQSTIDWIQSKVLHEDVGNRYVPYLKSGEEKILEQKYQSIRNEQIFYNRRKESEPSEHRRPVIFVLVIPVSILISVE